MFLLDTNVVSEISSRAIPDEKVLAWFFAQSPDTLYISSITLAELIYGIELLPEGRRKDEIRDSVVSTLSDFQFRPLPFDEQAAPYYAFIAAQRKKLGQPIGPNDAMIAAIAMANDMAVVTQNIKDFENTGVRIINPWEHQN
ncbi:type II toxin-antitoxin system VapC family toxin [Bifidobacterium sp. ESL0745]|uniref:type II toxin-antitoxin system VapC family toxin n=1 Tax=Bifidobacterium sp. ESL0745 TaxID=2983226 RepID=UPI0023F9432F|nr:type II toxin-antitoxin system VapC family toxin [Bifidobacterium sp. ESL0745]MDF7666241.1 type II toxin-antitoxin system VapC family toxin [Bifidobacterium sp. ESL0745]